MCIYKKEVLSAWENLLELVVYLQPLQPPPPGFLPALSSTGCSTDWVNAADSGGSLRPAEGQMGSQFETRGSTTCDDLGLTDLDKQGFNICGIQRTRLLEYSID